MPKAGFLTPKAIGNRIKAKGLQKLRWYCQMCQKQCRDENGFKCHCESESHMRQMALFAETPEKYMDEYSREFEKDFMEIIKRRGQTRIKANVCYQEYVGDRNHFHMNSTKWETLTAFIQYLGKSGQCVVDNTEKGWFITYIDRNPLVLARQAAKERQAEHALDDEQRAARAIQQQVEAAKEAEKHVLENHGEAPKEFHRSEDAPKIEIQIPALGAVAAASGSSSGGSLSSGALSASSSRPKFSAPVGVFEAPASASASASGADKEKKDDKRKRPLSALEALMLEDAAKKAKLAQSKPSSAAGAAAAPNASSPLTSSSSSSSSSPPSSSSSSSSNKDVLPYWLRRGLIVKITNQDLLKGQLYKQKAEVINVHDKYVGEVRVLTSGTVVRIDQSELETVIPAIGKAVMVVNGPHRGHSGVLTSLDQDAFCVSVTLSTGPDAGQVITKLPYEHVCKI